MIRLFLLQLLLLMGFISASAQPGLQLSSADSIDVLLYEGLNIEQILVRGHDGPVVIKTEDRTFEADTSSWVTIQKTTYGYRIEHNQFSTYSHLVEIQSDRVSLIKTFSEETGHRYYRGRMFLKNLTVGEITPVNRIHLEDYVSSVTGSEMNFEDSEALKVQSVIARTYALWSLAQQSFDEYDLTDHTMSQVYLGELIFKPRYRDAALATSGEIVTWSNKLALTVFSSTCGGTTSSNQWVWSGDALPYLQAVVDNDACSASPHFNWSYKADIDNIKSVFRFSNYQQDPPTIYPEEDHKGRLITIKVGDQTMSGNTFRLKMIKAFGARSLKSTLFSMERIDKTLIFNGHGMGHGVGLCQWGALGLAESGWNYKDILRFYYRGTTVSNLYDWPSPTIILATS